jgi:hypothetical protein
MLHMQLSVEADAKCTAVLKHTDNQIAAAHFGHLQGVAVLRVNADNWCIKGACICTQA